MLTENGSKIVYKGGQPVMDQGVENLALISLFTRRGWAGNVLFKDPAQKIGSDFVDAGLEPITLGSLNNVRDAAIKALDHPLFGTVDVMVSNPTSYQTKADIILKPPGEDIKTLTLVKNGLNWIVQVTDPASRRIPESVKPRILIFNQNKITTDNLVKITTDGLLKDVTTTTEG